RALTETRVRDRLRAAEQRGACRLGRERRERQRADEALGVVGEDGRDVHARVDETTADLDRLVRGDPSADTENDSGHRTPPPRGSGTRLTKVRRPTFGQADSSGAESAISADAASSAP